MYDTSEAAERLEALKFALWVLSSRIAHEQDRSDPEWIDMGGEA